ncbi:unnamed protein product [Adineta steineri]|uniref:Uncharacterized protein n=1 Tax=Adineta steineri TaxID=433720 RepID=A0A813R3C2_9BILA|nr:unnamed protein product [Adineta steineri]
MRWCEGKEEGEIVVGGDGQGGELNQLYGPMGLSFDDERNLYIADQSESENTNNITQSTRSQKGFLMAIISITIIVIFTKKAETTMNAIRPCSTVCCAAVYFTCIACLDDKFDNVPAYCYRHYAYNGTGPHHYFDAYGGCATHAAAAANDTGYGGRYIFNGTITLAGGISAPRYSGTGVYGSSVCKG